MHTPAAAAAAVLLAAALAAPAVGHGIMSQPRQRGALNTQRDVPNPVMDASATIDYCPHCLNCGGVGSVRKGGPWSLFLPFEKARGGITLCGDPVGDDAHMRSGTFANPPSMPYAATYAPGSVANFEYDITAHHNGFLSFYLCDVSSTGDVVNTVEFFKAHCHELERSPHPGCEAGTDKGCGPIDPKYPGRWVLPCKDGSPDQVFGGANGKMAYKIPDLTIADGVVISYWLTQNTCNSPDGFMDDYAYPPAWAGCPGDGGTLGAHPTFKDCLTTGQVPEEFFSCADVTVGAGGSSAAPAPASPPTTKATTTKVSAGGATTAVGTDSATAVVTTKGATTGAATKDYTPTPAATEAPVAYASSGGGSGPRVVPPASPTTVEQSKDCAKEPGILQPTASTATCAGHWKQCGGKSHSGPTTCCEAAYSCVELNPYYSQCLTQA